MVHDVERLGGDLAGPASKPVIDHLVGIALRSSHSKTFGRGGVEQGDHHPPGVGVLPVRLSHSSSSRCRC